MTEIAVESLLDAAREQFLRTGVRRTSGDDIARRAGVNRATLYRRVGTKEEIVRRTYLQETQRVLAVIEKATGPVPAPGTPDFDPVAYIERFFTVTITELRDNPLLGQLLEIDREQALIGLDVERRRDHQPGESAGGGPGSGASGLCRQHRGRRHRRFGGHAGPLGPIAPPHPRRSAPRSIPQPDDHLRSSNRAPR